MINFGNFEFIVVIKGSNLGRRGEEIQEYVAQNREHFFTFTLGWDNDGVNLP